jgi:hypothetical protein
MITDEIRENLPPLQADYTKATGRPFAHFYCPLLCRDEDVELCMGHIISKTWKNCCRATVVQRGDIDHWYGSIAEAEFGTLLDARRAGLHGVVRDEELRRQVRPKILVEGEECSYYTYEEGKSSPQHTHIELALTPDAGDDVIRLVLKKHPSKMQEDRGKRWSMVVDRDWRPPIIVSVIKAAYLTLFKMLGYGYALSSGGLEIGRFTLGRFFEENNGKSRNEVREAIPKFFRPYRHIVRPIGEFGGPAPRGTIEDNRVGICFGSSGRPWAMMVFVRIEEDVFAVLMPASDHIDSLDAYRSFREEDEDRWLNVSEAVFEPARGHWEACENPFRVFWPKQSGTFDLDCQIRPS